MIPRPGILVGTALCIVLICQGTSLGWAACTSATSRTWFNGEWLVNYSGDIGGTRKIGMTLIFKERQVHGVYFNVEDLKDIPIFGTIWNGVKIQMTEHAKNGAKSRMLFRGEFKKVDPRKHFDAPELSCEVISGSWRDLEGRELPFYLKVEHATHGTLGNRYAAVGATSDKSIEKSAQAFWHAVENNDKNRVAELIQYPINVYVKGETITISKANNFISIYDQIFSLSFRESILEAIPHNMFVKYSGVMLGDGQVWFGADGRVTQLNVSSREHR